MKNFSLVVALSASFVALGQVESPSSESKPSNEVYSPKVDTASVPGLLIGVGILPGHTLRRGDVISTPVRIQLMGTKLYKGFGLFAAVEFASADIPFRDNSDPEDPSEWSDSYFRHMLGIQYSFGKFGAYAGMDMFSQNGFFRSVGEGSASVGSGRKTLGVTYNAFKGLTVSLDFSAYAGPAIGVNYLVPLKGLK